jgi:hypothetical protein
MLNTNSALDPQSLESRLAHVRSDEPTNHTPDPLHDAEAYSRKDYERDIRDAQGDMPVDHTPDPLHDAEAYRTHGTPGDGSGEDDLADLMAHGDEGCCDGPEDAGLDALYEDRFDSAE